MIDIKTILLMSTIIITLLGCASKIPPEIRVAPADNPTYVDVKNNLSDYRSLSVRWGGLIARVENKSQATWIEVVAKKLEKSGRPKDVDESPGRFIAIIDGFLDPMVYRADREITVAGVINDSVNRNIDEYDYQFPVIKVNHHKLWQQVYVSPCYDHFPYRVYDPWYPYHVYYWRKR